jgi:hypothetical protein
VCSYPQKGRSLLKCEIRYCYNLMMKLFNITSLKFFGGFVAIVVGSIVIAFIAIYFSPESRYERATASLQEQYANDIYGGDTPEETLELFIQALEDGDVDLASRYAVVEKQDLLLGELKDSIENGFLDDYIDILVDSIKHKSHNEELNSYEFRSVYKGENIFVARVVLNTSTDKWKISEI